MTFSQLAPQLEFSLPHRDRNQVSAYSTLSTVCTLLKRFNPVPYSPVVSDCRWFLFAMSLSNRFLRYNPPVLDIQGYVIRNALNTPSQRIEEARHTSKPLNTSLVTSTLSHWLTNNHPASPPPWGSRDQDQRHSIHISNLPKLSGDTPYSFTNNREPLRVWGWQIFGSNLGHFSQ